MKSQNKTGYIHYNKDLKQFSRELRNNSTLGEKLLWNQLKTEKILGYQFNRQKPIGNYIIDFYCKNLNLVIEVDGYSHQFKTEEDLERESDLKKMGVNMIRFIEQECRKQMMNVVRAIEIWIEEQPIPLLPFTSGRENKKIQIPPAPLYKGEINSQ